MYIQFEQKFQKKPCYPDNDYTSALSQKENGSNFDAMKEKTTTVFTDISVENVDISQFSI